MLPPCFFVGEVSLFAVFSFAGESYYSGLVCFGGGDLPRSFCFSFFVGEVSTSKKRKTAKSELQHSLPSTPSPKRGKRIAPPQMQ